MGVIFSALMWKGRFSLETADAVKRFSESISFDWRLYRHDICASVAHARALLGAGILDESEFSAIERGLNDILVEIAGENFVFDPGLEDIHMNIEAALTEKAGATGARLHTARSRNDQVATSLRLYLREEIDVIREGVRLLQQSLVALAERAGRTLIPGYTHLQRAQPVPFAHHLLAYVEMLDRDSGRLADGRQRMNFLPLGSGALAGSTIPLDREAMARELGFDGVTRNSMDAVSDRDFAVEFLAAAALLGIHLSRLGEDMVLWASTEFHFIHISDAFTTGSSLMPQKKNPDVAELARGKSGRLTGNLVSLLVLLKGLPMTYNRDLQEDKERVFDSVDTLRITLEVFAGMIDGTEIHAETMQHAAADPMLLATDIADYLVRKGVPFRHAHETVGRLTALSLAESLPFAEVPLERYRELNPAFESDVFAVFDPEQAMRARTATGAPSHGGVHREINRWKAKLAANNPSPDKSRA